MSKFAVGQKVKVVAIDPEFGDDKKPEYTKHLGEEHVISHISTHHMYPIEVEAGLIFAEMELEAAE